MKSVLVINYSQSGQLDEIIDHFIKPFPEASIERVKVAVKEPFPFPWRGGSFFNVMPECVDEVAIELEPIHFAKDAYDLIILGHQPWFLSPSLPTTSLLQNETFRKLLANTPVITIMGSRNMWINAQESVKHQIYDNGGTLVGNIPLIDRTQNHISVITIFDWMFNAKKRRLWGIFPMPGVSQKEIEGMDRYGEMAVKALETNQFDDLQKRFLSLGEIKIHASLMFTELRAKAIFRIWAKKIRKPGTSEKKRKRLVKVFSYYLLFALFLIAPIVLIIYNILVRPFIFKSIKRKKEYFRGTKITS